ncbi:substrate-binding domain-containing protein [Streptomyces iranensis]|uniref:substrate-binding domain-containing protein n=1 Tax=Streptomyces iranensis TaxID=576784 RepID=UPI0039B75CE2
MRSATSSSAATGGSRCSTTAAARTPVATAPATRCSSAPPPKHGLPADGEWVFPAANSLEGGAAAMDDVLAGGFGATAVLTYNDLIAIGAMRRARDRGMRVPEDCAFVGCDGLTLSRLVDPPLTTLTVDKELLGRAAVRQVAAQMTGAGPGETVIVPRLVVRASS